MNESKPTTAPRENGARQSKLTSPLFLWPAGVVLAGGLFLFLTYMVGVFTHESTDDAFIAGHIVSIAPRVSGQVTHVYVNDNQMVHSNEPLVSLDPTDYATTVAQKQAAALSQKADVKTLISAYALMKAKVVTAKAAARAAQADAAAAEATAAQAKSDFKRAQKLQQQNTISAEEFDAAQATYAKDEADAKSKQEDADQKESMVDEARKQQATILAQREMAIAQFDEAQTNVAAAKLNLSYTTVYAPCAGRVTRKSVEVGDYLQLGQQIMFIVPKQLWVVANFKESQLKNMAPGQPATVSIDALDGETFRAHVQSIQAGSGSEYSLLPPENATGNFVKVVQRVPVKIVFDEPLPPGEVLGPGLSVEPSVRTSSFSVPAWLIGLVSIILAAVIAVVFRKAAQRKAAEN